MYDIPYAPIRYYPPGEEPNVWKQLHPTNNNTPGKRIFSSMVVDNNYKYLYLYGGIGIDKDNKYTIYNDLWRYDIFLNIWELMYMMGVSEIKRTVINKLMN